MAFIYSTEISIALIQIRARVLMSPITPLFGKIKPALLGK